MTIENKSYYYRHNLFHACNKSEKLTIKMYLKKIVGDNYQIVWGAKKVQKRQSMSYKQMKKLLFDSFHIFNFLNYFNFYNFFDIFKGVRY